MQTDVAAVITSQSDDELTEIVRQVLGENATPTGGLTTTKIGRSAGTGTAGVFHVTGRAQTNGRETEWSAVVKALGTPEVHSTGRQVVDPYKEVEVYRSCAFAESHGGVRSACCYAIQPRDELLLLWLEDLSHAPQAPWDADHFIATARHLGQFNAYWPEEALPDWDWLSHTGFRSSFTGSPRLQRVFERLPGVIDHPLMRIYLSMTPLVALIQLWHDLDDLLALAETTSRGVCHRDCHPKNLFPMNETGHESFTVGIDWVMVGIDNLGLDVGHLLSSPMQWLELTPDEAANLREPVFDAYMSGLNASGYSGDVDGVRLTYLTRLAVTAIRNTNLTMLAMDSDKFGEQIAQMGGRSIDEIVSQWAHHVDFYLACRDDALTVAKRLVQQIS